MLQLGRTKLIEKVVQEGKFPGFRLKQVRLPVDAGTSV